MKAVEFIKKFGWDYAKERLDYCKNARLVGMEIDLKRYVDAYELVQKFGGIKRAKRILRKSYLSWNNRVSVVWNDNPFQCTIQQLEEAIALVEEVENFNG